VSPSEGQSCGKDDGRRKYQTKPPNAGEVSENSAEHFIQDNNTENRVPGLCGPVHIEVEVIVVTNHKSGDVRDHPERGIDKETREFFVGLSSTQHPEQNYQQSQGSER